MRPVVMPVPELVGVDIIRDLRHAVLRGPTRPMSASHYPQDLLPETFHLAIRDELTVLGCATFFPQPLPAELSGNAGRAWRLRGMAVAAKRQGQGLGSSLLRFGLAEIAGRRGTLLWCNARTSAVGFYLNHGFTVVGDEFLIENGIPHVVAVCPVPGAGSVDAFESGLNSGDAAHPS